MTHKYLPTLAAALAVVSLLFARPPAVRQTRYEEIRGIVGLFAGENPSAAAIRQAADWEVWVGRHDRDARARIDRGIEDSIGNLILYGTAFTELPRLAGAESAASRDGLTAAAFSRLNALITALDKQGGSERLTFIREFLAGKGIVGRARFRYFSENLQRLCREQRDYQERLSDAGRDADSAALLLSRGTLYEHRGLSVDTSLLPNFGVETTLEALKKKGVLPSKSIRKAAIVGPGLDFVDKRDGYDFYPPQTLQPFALIEGLIRLNFSDAAGPQVVTMDLSPAVNSHIAELSAWARSGKGYTIQLPRDPQTGWTEQAISYWRNFGELIGSPAVPAGVPQELKGLLLRATRIKPQYEALVQPLDVDIVTRTADLPDDWRFDLVIATNVLVYYDRFEQALAMANIAHMMHPGSVLVVNHVLPAQHPQELEYLGRRSVSYSNSGAFGDDFVVYRRTPYDN